MLDRLQSETRRNDFTITIVQNSDQEISKKYFEEKISRYNDINVLYPISNLGSAGGYALGQEYLLHAGYTHIIMLEDDVELYEPDTISATIDAIYHEKDVIFIHHPVNTNGQHSWYVQYACYPATLIEEAGIIDPRYFFRAEDLEWGKRIESVIEKGGYVKNIIDRNYYHPYLKGGNNTGSWIYFSIRNQLWSYLKHRQGLLHLLMTLTQYIAFGLLVFFRSGKALVLRCLWYAFADGTGKYKSLEYHGNMISRLGQYRKVSLNDLGFDIHEAGLNTIESGVNACHPIARMTLADADRKHLSTYPGSLIVSGGFQPALGTVVSCMKKLCIIEDLDRVKKKVTAKVIVQENGSLIVNLLLFLPCSLLGGITMIFAGIWLLGISYLRR